MQRKWKYIHELRDWPEFEWNNSSLIELIGAVRNLQGRIVGKMDMLGFELQNEAVLETLTLDIIKSNEIEGEILNPAQVRSSLAKRLGMNIGGLVYSERNVEGVVEMMLDATQKYDKKLSAKRLFDWHSALFPTGKNGMYKLIVGNWRNDASGAMEVVSGALGMQKVHFEAPNALRIPEEMKAFINWFNAPDKTDPVIKSAIAHLWFITIHPFEDGNGRIARALADMILARADGTPQRYYSMSSQIRIERNDYYEILEKTQKGSIDITEWLTWFLKCLLNALKSSEVVLNDVIFKHNFWNNNRNLISNERQRLLINKLLDGFTGKLTSTKWGKIAKCSPDSALRDINDLITKGVLIKESGGGRSTNYLLNR